MKTAVADLAHFADALRSRGITVTPDQVTGMAEALTIVDPAARDEVYAALRALSITDPGQRRAFDEEFRRLFEQAGRALEDTGDSTRLAAVSEHRPVVETIPEQEVEDAVSQTGASSIENISARDFADLNDEDLEQAKRLIARMLWKPSAYRTRRWEPDSLGRRPDLRRTLGRSVGPEGDLMRVSMKDRRQRRRPLIMLADISGSMERYSEMFLVFAHAARQHIGQVEVFTFSTHLTRVTPDLEKRDPKIALSKVSKSVTDWSGGTKIGEALREWNKSWSRRLSRGRPVAMILSDGWDCGEPDLLRTEMSRLARSVSSVIWLNPLAARAGYEPATRGMKAVLPHVDHLLPAASVNDLGSVVKLLDQVAR